MPVHVADRSTRTLRGIDHRRRAVRAVRLIARHRIGPQAIAIDPEPIAITAARPSMSPRRIRRPAARGDATRSVRVQDEVDGLSKPAPRRVRARPVGLRARRRRTAGGGRPASPSTGSSSRGVDGSDCGRARRAGQARTRPCGRAVSRSSARTDPNATAVPRRRIESNADLRLPVGLLRRAPASMAGAPPRRLPAPDPGAAIRPRGSRRRLSP